MSKVYLPSEYVNSSCKVVYSDYIRVYTNSSYTEYVDIFPKNDYLIKKGSNTYPPNNVVCDTLNEYTDNYYYRTDFDSILIIFSIMSIFIVFLPLKIVFRLFKKGRL